MNLVAEVVARILYGAVITDRRSYSDESTEAMRQLHWCIHDVESKYTRRCGPVDRVWMDEGYTTHRCSEGK